MIEETIKQLAEKAAAESSFDNREHIAQTIERVFTPAIRELGPCGKHPKMFWVEGTGRGKYATYDHCTVCADNAAQVAAALREAAEIVSNGVKATYTTSGVANQTTLLEIRDAILSLIPDPSALDRRKP
jgi:hypothetical protein